MPAPPARPPVVRGWAAVGWSAALGGLLVVDLVLSQTYFGVNPPALAAGLGVGLTVLLVPRHLFEAACIAVLGSVAVTTAVSALDPLLYTRALGRGAWPGMAEPVGLLLLLALCLRWLPLEQAAFVGVGVVGAGAAALRVRQEVDYGTLLTTLYGLALLGAAGAGLYLRWIDADRARAVDLVRQDERLAIARELHDVVAHHVTGIVVQAQAAQEVWDQRPDAVRKALGRIEAAGADALASMRRLVDTLRSDDDGPLAPTATLADLRDLAERSTQVGLPVRLHLDGVTELPTAVAPSVHRVVGEAITNAQRHASGATGVDVRLRRDGEHLELEVTDDGRPGRAAGTGYGLTGMAERAAALGGRLEAGPAPGGGWRIHARLPLGGAA